MTAASLLRLWLGGPHAGPTSWRPPPPPPAAPGGTTQLWTLDGLAAVSRWTVGRTEAMVGRPGGGGGSLLDGQPETVMGNLRRWSGAIAAVSHVTGTDNGRPASQPNSEPDQRPRRLQLKLDDVASLISCTPAPETAVTKMTGHFLRSSLVPSPPMPPSCRTCSCARCHRQVTHRPARRHV